MVENTFTTMPDIGRELFGGIPGVAFLPDFCFKNQVIKIFITPTAPLLTDYSFRKKKL